MSIYSFLRSAGKGESSPKPPEAIKEEFLKFYKKGFLDYEKERLDGLRKAGVLTDEEHEFGMNMAEEDARNFVLPTHRKYGGRKKDYVFYNNDGKISPAGILVGGTAAVSAALGAYTALTSPPNTTPVSDAAPAPTPTPVIPAITSESADAVPTPAVTIPQSVFDEIPFLKDGKVSAVMNYEGTQGNSSKAYARYIRGSHVSEVAQRLITDSAPILKIAGNMSDDKALTEVFHNKLGFYNIKNGYVLTIPYVVAEEADVKYPAIKSFLADCDLEDKDYDELKIIKLSPAKNLPNLISLDDAHKKVRDALDGKHLIVAQYQLSDKSKRTAAAIVSDNLTNNRSALTGSMETGYMILAGGNVSSDEFDCVYQDITEGKGGSMAILPLIVPTPITTPTPTPFITPAPTIPAPSPTPELTPTPLPTPIATILPTVTIPPATPIPTPTVTVLPTVTIPPTPLITPAPIIPPAPIFTPEPVETPEPIETPEPTRSPEPTAPPATPPPVDDPGAGGSGGDAPTVTPPLASPPPATTTTPVQPTNQPEATPLPFIDDSGEGEGGGE